MSSKPAIRPRPPSVEAVLKRCARASTVSIPMLSPPSCARPSTRSGRTWRQAWIPATRCPRRRRRARLEDLADTGLTPAINATGVIVHTNLGRASWPSPVADAIARLSREPLLLELDRETDVAASERGSPKTTWSP